MSAPNSPTNNRLITNNKDSITSEEQGIHPPPPMSAWNGGLRFALEMASLVGIGHYGYSIGSVAWSQYLLAAGLPLTAATMWGVFNVINDPSRGGSAPIPVSGLTRLGVELSVLGFGGYSLGAWNPWVGGVYGALGVLHYVSYWKRVQWLLQQKKPNSRPIN